MGFLFLVIAIGVYFIATGKAPFILKIVPYATLVAAISFVAGTTFLDYRGKRIKKAIPIGGIVGVSSFFLLISMVEGILFLVEKDFSTKSLGILLIAFSFCIVISTTLLWLAKSRLY